MRSPLAWRHRLHPSLLLVFSFAFAIAVGAGLLALPLATQDAPIGWLDAIFTATSAACVTGLTVVDTGTTFSRAGQAIVLGLIQVGGLGIMTFSVLVTIILRRGVSFADRRAVQDSLHHSATGELGRLVAYVVVFTFLVEGAGFLVLWAHWHALPDAAWTAFFHSISAFCNAGFSTFADSLVRYQTDLVVNLAVTGLIIVGGLGFIVNRELCAVFQHHRRGEGRAPLLSLHSKLVLFVTACLLVVGTLAFLGLESHNLLAGRSLWDRLLMAWFHSVSARTAGFNTLNLANATSGTLCMLTLLMFVGASPGSTGGGVKTTTLGLLVALARARWSGRGRAMMFRRTVPHASMDRALALILFAGTLVTLAVLAMTVLAQGGGPHGATHPQFDELMFEVVSAFGTVGLSTGITPTLSPGAKILLIVMMFVGRVGPLTIALAAGRRREQGRFRYAEENVMVG